MENNELNKAKFFAQYWDVNCIDNPDFAWRSNETFDTVLSVYNGSLTKWYAKLNPLSLITDEDAIELCKLLGVNYDKDNLLFTEKVVILSENQSDCTDYLRSQGYALPWMGLSVETLVDYGWVKLNEAK